MFAAPKIVNFVEQGGVYGIQKALLDNGVAFGHLKAGVIVVGLSISLLGALALSSRRHPGRGLAFACLLCAALMVGQNWAARSYEYSASRLTRIQFVPTRADWVDHYATGPVATLDVGKNLPLRANSVIFTEFFNKKIKAYYSTIATGNGCDIDLAKDGTAKHGDDKCKVWPRNWVLADGPVATTLKGQKVLARTTRSGVLVATPPGPPRVLSLVAAPCTVYGCTGEFRLGTYLDKPSEVSVRFGPGSVDHRVQLGTTKVQTLPAGEPVNLHFNLPAGPQAATLPVDWSDPDGAPRLEAVAIRTADGKTYRVY
jgi:hypothetical protein